MGGRELLMVALSALLHASWSGSIRSSRDPMAFNVAQGLVTVGLGMLLLPWAGLGALQPGTWLLLAATGAAHGLYWYGLSRSLAETELSLAYPIIRATPAFLPWIAVPLLGEAITPLGALGIAIVVAGIAWLREPGATAGEASNARRRMGLAYFTLATTVAYSLLDKQLMGTLAEAPWTSPLPRSLVVYFLISAAGWLGFLPWAATHLASRGLRSTLGTEARGIAFAAAIGIAGYSLILEAYQTAPASYVVAVRQLSVFFALGIAVLVLGERPSRRRVLGATATVAGVVLIALRG